jgi:hypothetical protein
MDVGEGEGGSVPGGRRVRPGVRCWGLAVVIKRKSDLPRFSRNDLVNSVLHLGVFSCKTNGC